jgi:hypothetical protein
VLKCEGGTSSWASQLVVDQTALVVVQIKKAAVPDVAHDAFAHIITSNLVRGIGMRGEESESESVAHPTTGIRIYIAGTGKNAGVE